MPDLDWNVNSWNKTYAWSEEGEEWSASWGSSEAQWLGVIYPRLHSFLPCESVLEIATGCGRWTRFLVAAARKNFVGIDIAEKCIAACEEKFGGLDHTRFVLNDGTSLDGAGPGPFDLVFSFDSLVHADIGVLGEYIPQIISRLSDTGVAWIHHSNVAEVFENEKLNDRRLPLEKRHYRDNTVSAELVRDLIESNGGDCLVQETVNWGCDKLIDCLTLFRRKRGDSQHDTVRLQNYDFMVEANSVRQHIQPYCLVRNVDSKS